MTSLKARAPGTVGARLTAGRAAVGLTQEEAAEQVGVSRTELVAYETGARVPQWDRAVKLADVYGITLDWLFGRTAGGGPVVPMAMASGDL